MWNSGRLPSMRAMHWPLRRPRPWRPAAIASDRSRHWPQVIATSSPLVRMATWSSRWPAVIRNASAIVAASAARAVMSLMRATLSHTEPLAAQPPDVVGEPHDEQEGDEHDPDDARLL